MLFAVLFTDKPDHGALRAQHLDAHVRWVARHQDSGVEVLHWSKALDRKVPV